MTLKDYRAEHPSQQLGLSYQCLVVVSMVEVMAEMVACDNGLEILDMLLACHKRSRLDLKADHGIVALCYILPAQRVDLVIAYHNPLGYRMDSEELAFSHSWAPTGFYRILQDPDLGHHAGQVFPERSCCHILEEDLYRVEGPLGLFHTLLWLVHKVHLCRNHAVDNLLVLDLHAIHNHRQLHQNTVVALAVRIDLSLDP